MWSGDKNGNSLNARDASDRPMASPAWIASLSPMPLSLERRTGPAMPAMDSDDLGAWLEWASIRG